MGDEDAMRDLIAVRCEACGDTFTIHRGDDSVCPTCGCDRTHEAHEPLL
ncbi:MAG: hypothetical protein ACR2LG_04230 [Actinomycetota bacterium]|nr:hypothetical protein [Actinomycetota bacterium]